MTDHLGAAPLGMTCPCVKVHRPDPGVDLDLHHLQPRSWFGPDVPANRIWIDPTLHRRVHTLLELYVRLQREPTKAEQKPWPPYARKLAAEAIKRFGGIPPKGHGGGAALTVAATPENRERLQIAPW